MAAVFDKGGYAERIERDRRPPPVNRDYDLGFVAGEQVGFDRGFKAATDKYISIGHKDL
jgi:hypothetical protein